MMPVASGLRSMVIIGFLIFIHLFIRSFDRGRKLGSVGRPVSADRQVQLGVALQPQPQMVDLAEEFLFRDIVRQDDEFIAADAVAGIRSETGPQVIRTGPQRFIAAVMTKLIIDFF